MRAKEIVCINNSRKNIESFKMFLNPMVALAAINSIINDTSFIVAPIV